MGGYSSLAQHEWADGSGLEMYETPARMYDAQIGRFGQTDPLAEQSANASEYAFVLNNPVSMVDPMGLTPIEDLINEAWNNSGSYGGYFEVENGRLRDMDGGGSYNFTSQNEAFGFGAAQMGANGWYGASYGYASSFSQALNRFNGGHITAGMVEGYYTQRYAGINYFVQASGSPNGKGFNLTYYTNPGGPLTSNDPYLQIQYASYEKMFALLKETFNKTDADEVNLLYENLTEGSETIENSWTLARTPGYFNKGYRIASDAANSGAMGFVTKATGIVSVVDDAIKIKEAYNEGNVGGVIWNSVKGVATVGFLIFGGEELELGWNLGTMAVDGIVDLFSDDD